MDWYVLTALLALAGSPAVSAGLDHQASRVTTKATAPFAQCFVAAQERAFRAWSFVPKADGGGTFSNAGAPGVRHPYVLEVADRGGVRELRLSPSSDRSVLRSVDGCI